MANTYTQIYIQSNNVKPLRGLDFRSIFFSIDMNALTGKMKTFISIKMDIINTLLSVRTFISINNGHDKMKIDNNFVSS